MHRFISLLLISLIACNLSDDQNDVVSVEVDTEGQQKDTVEKKQELKNPNSLEVIFENQSGRKVELYWDDNVNGVLQSKLSHTSQITINTFIGHKFYFTPSESGGNKENILYQIIMEPHIGLVTLHDPKTMKERDQEFERNKNIWMRQYHERTGRKWKNYYPRQNITHYMHNFTHIGQEIVEIIDHGQFNMCEQQQIEEVSANIQQQITDDKDEKKGNMPQSYKTETETFDVIYYNETYFCRDKSSTDVPITIKVQCVSPKVAYFDNFLSEAEVQHIINVGVGLGLKRSTVSEEALLTEDRTSSTVWIERKYSHLIDDIVRRIAQIIHIDQQKLFLNASSESLQLVHYEPGQLYKAHVDYGTDRPHNRYITFLMYLNDVNGGGYTSFPRASKECKDENGRFAVEPKLGRVAFFYDLLADGNVDELSQHYAEPPDEGNEKWMTNLWIWDQVFTR